MRLRVASSEDARRIAEIHVGAWQVAYRGQLPDEYLDSLSIDAREAVWHEMLLDSNLPAFGVFVVEDDSHGAVGFAAVSPSRDPDALPATGEVGSIYLLSEFWGIGYGRALLSRATECMREAGCTTATLWVLDSNTRARTFYEAAGWTHDGAEKTDDRGTFSMHEVRYRRAL